VTGAASDPRREQREQLPHRVRTAAQHVHEVAIREGEGHRLGHCRDRGRPRTLIEERDLAEDITAAVQRDHDLLATLFGHGDLHRA
jgi:hypothetical protein